GEITRQGEQLVDVLGRLTPEPGGSAALDRRLLDDARRQMARAFDSEHGGFGDAPKFPQPSGLERILRHWRGTANDEQPDTEALYMASLTLMRMAEGGLRDHVGGGFYRYSVDRSWTIPHFEKML